MRRYGAYVLIVEILGASTVFLYGTNLLFDPVMEKFEEDEANPGRPKARIYIISSLSDALNEAIASNPVKFQGCLHSLAWILNLCLFGTSHNVLMPTISILMSNYIHTDVDNCTSQVSMPYHVRVLVPCYKGDFFNLG